MEIIVPPQTIPGQTITIKGSTITVQPEPLEINGQTIPQVAQTITIPDQTIKTQDYTIPGYKIVVADQAPQPTPIPTPPTSPTDSGRIFSPDSFWYKKLSDSTPIHSKASQYANELVLSSKPVIMSNGGKQWGDPWLGVTRYSTSLYIITDPSVQKVVVKLVKKPSEPDWQTDYLKNCALQQELNKGFRMPPNYKIAGGEDKHLTVWDKVDDSLYEMWLSDHAGPLTGRWGAVIRNVSKHPGYITRLPSGERQGATATALPVIGGTILKSHLENGVIDTVLAMDLPFPHSSFVFPAQDSDGYSSKPSWLVPPLPWTPSIPEGQRFRLPTSYIVPAGAPPIVKMILTALKEYGAVVRDKSGSLSFFIEDPSKYGMGENMLDPYMDGKKIWDVMAMIPWSQFQALA